MRNTIIILLREFRQLSRLKSFWLTLLLLPLAIIIGPLAEKALDKHSAYQIAVIDHSDGGLGKPLAERLILEHDRQVLYALARDLETRGDRLPDGKYPSIRDGRWPTVEDAAAFRASGGLDAAVRSINAAGHLRLSAADLDRHPLKVSFQAAGKDDLIITIPTHFPNDRKVVLSSASAVPADRLVAVESALANVMPTAGISSGQAHFEPELTVTVSAASGQSDATRFARSVVPAATAYLLMICLTISGLWMQQGLVEERSSKLIEALLACCSPNQIMLGKLGGTAAVGLSIAAIWGSGAAIAAYSNRVEFDTRSLQAAASVMNAGHIAALFFFFLVGFAILLPVYFMIGLKSKTMQDAQGYITPLLLIIMLPVTVLIKSVLTGAANNAFFDAMIWIPIWTPFAILARIGGGISDMIIVIAALYCLAVVYLEFRVFSRYFRKTVLSGSTD